MVETVLSHSIDEDERLSSQKWEINYLEAAIFLEEGENNDKFDSHPGDKSALPAYMITHNHWFYTLDLCAASILLLLALLEPPAVEVFANIPTGVHSSIELCALSILGVSIGLQIRWLGFRLFLQHKRSLGKTIVWLIMLIEAFVVLARNSSHFRVTRALRPIFLIDNRYLGGVRRLLRQIFQSLPPILEVMVLMFFSVLIFVVFGFYLFSSNPMDPYFTSFYQTFVSLYVLLTTANFPDVMMPSYAKSRWSSVFFIIFLSVVLYFIMNLMLAIVFVSFSNIEREKFRKLFLHKRAACQHAFQLLISHLNQNGIAYQHLDGLLRYYKPKLSKLNVYLMFKSLNRSMTGSVSLREFYSVYDAVEFQWHLQRDERPWFDELYPPARRLCQGVLTMIETVWFKIATYCVILTSSFILIFRTVMFEPATEVGYVAITWDQMSCVVFYVVELVLKLLAYGFDVYFSSGWNFFDFIVTIITILGIMAQRFGASFFFVLILRPLR